MIYKSQLLKNVPIQLKDYYLENACLNRSEEPVYVKEYAGEYYVQRGLDTILHKHSNSDGDDLIRCYIEHVSCPPL